MIQNKLWVKISYVVFFTIVIILNFYNNSYIAGGALIGNFTFLLFMNYIIRPRNVKAFKYIAKNIDDISILYNKAPFSEEHNKYFFYYYKNGKMEKIFFNEDESQMYITVDEKVYTLTTLICFSLLYEKKIKKRLRTILKNHDPLEGDLLNTKTFDKFKRIKKIEKLIE